LGAHLDSSDGTHDAPAEATDSTGFAPVDARQAAARGRADASKSLANGRYEIVEFVGKGGMGAVYRARDVELGRSVAVKGLVDAGRRASRELALREARTLAALAHPNIMRVYDVLMAGEQIWLVTEWLEGRCLAQLPLPLPPAVVLAVMAQVYEALAAAHAASVMHRDVKPANVMIGSDGRVTLIDFGVALANGDGGDDTIAGSLRYTDPRILEGDAPDAASDLYSAALLQVELMTGQPVLPDLAPLALHRHIKKNLAGRLDALLDGQWPPLAALSRDNLRSPTSTGIASACVLRARNWRGVDPGAVRTARDAAFAARAALLDLTPMPPEQVLAAALERGTFDDPDAGLALRRVTAEHLADAHLPLRQKASWVAFAATLGPEADQPIPMARSATPHDAQHSRALAALAVMVLLLAGALVFMVLNPMRSGDDALGGHGPSMLAWLDYGRAAVAQPSTATATGGTLLEARTAEPAPSTPKDTAAATPLLAPAAAPPIASAPQHAAAATIPVHIVANAWATVVVDGRTVGRLPQAAPFALAPGRHELRLENPSVQPFATELDVGPATPRRLHFTLSPKTAPRRLTLARPGRLVVDGVDHGVVSSKILRLAYGTHDIEIVRGRRQVRRERLALGPDSPRDIALE
jgi:hypothetical protein